jgi:hypothetical protein
VGNFLNWSGIFIFRGFEAKNARITPRITEFSARQTLQNKNSSFPVRPALFLHLDKRNQEALSGVNIDRSSNYQEVRPRRGLSQA